MEADLARYYQIELADLWRGRLSLRRLFVLLRWLPYESAVAQIERDLTEKAEAAQAVADVENALAPFQR